ncbi:type II toxin-antitoxin system RelE/ParE family toxin [Brevundimonas sp. Leaf363]|uniref:type II toxin-antitoxin system RelE/ParE family toxin n=1 Tax=Brevundimonas sp. Leaf363 TaxID=1736353 RepID=UPI000AF40659|nr:type II toxin-antitoxin system RelE/ParE family toxin [Brevundimonas sp. Leaf363]
MKAIWTPQAQAELEDGVNFIARDNISAAIATEDRVLASAAGLRDFPNKGRARPDGRRELVVAATPFLLVYRVEHDSVLILRVWHTSREPQA